MSINNVVLTEHFERFIETSVISGRFQDASEVIREGLRLVEQRERENTARIEWLRGAANEGFDELDRGEGTGVESDEALEGFMESIARDISSELHTEPTRG